MYPQEEAGKAALKQASWEWTRRCFSVVFRATTVDPWRLRPVFVTPAADMVNAMAVEIVVVGGGGVVVVVVAVVVVVVLVAVAVAAAVVAQDPSRPPSQADISGSTAMRSSGGKTPG